MLNPMKRSTHTLIGIFSPNTSKWTGAKPLNTRLQPSNSDEIVAQERGAVRSPLLEKDSYNHVWNARLTISPPWLIPLSAVSTPFRCERPRSPYHQSRKPVESTRPVPEIHLQSPANGFSIGIATLTAIEHYRASASTIPDERRLAGGKYLVFGLEGYEVGGCHGLRDSVHTVESRSKRRLEEDDSQRLIATDGVSDPAELLNIFEAPTTKQTLALRCFQISVCQGRENVLEQIFKESDRRLRHPMGTRRGLKRLLQFTCVGFLAEYPELDVFKLLDIQISDIKTIMPVA
ncbi:hypothetical protein N7448_011094 [Penicillium atrosanguineum]|nr:hypothetical protein N7448_011094 [Penicillium atrosanguineum]